MNHIILCTMVMIIVESTVHGLHINYILSKTNVQTKLKYTAIMIVIVSITVIAIVIVTV